MNAYKLYIKYSIDDLVKLSEQLTANPANKIDAISPYIYNKKILRKLDNIRWAITYHLRDERKANGEIINEAGYSGRMTNRRR